MSDGEPWGGGARVEPRSLGPVDSCGHRVGSCDQKVIMGYLWEFFVSWVGTVWSAVHVVNRRRIITASKHSHALLGYSCTGFNEDFFLFVFFFFFFVLGCACATDAMSQPMPFAFFKLSLWYYHNKLVHLHHHFYIPLNINVSIIISLFSLGRCCLIQISKFYLAVWHESSKNITRLMREISNRNTFLEMHSKKGAGSVLYNLIYARGLMHATYLHWWYMFKNHSSMV